MIGAIVGLIVLLFASGVGETHWLGGLFLGALAAALLGGLLVWLNNDSDAADYEPRLSEVPKAPAQAPAMPLVHPAAAEDVIASAPVMAPLSAEPLTEPAEKKKKPSTKSSKKDDLTEISGIGPKTQKKLNKLGIKRFAQIAEWDRAAERKFADELGRQGARIRKDDWTGQARALMNSKKGQA